MSNRNYPKYVCGDCGLETDNAEAFADIKMHEAEAKMSPAPPYCRKAITEAHFHGTSILD